MNDFMENLLFFLHLIIYNRGIFGGKTPSATDAVFLPYVVDDIFAGVGCD